jgi:hypothetical protein
MDITETIAIRRAPAEVFAYLADFANDPRWRRDVRAMVPEPAGLARVGTTVHEELRFCGRTHHTDTTVTEVEADGAVRFAGQGSGGAVAGRRSVRAHALGTEVRLELHVETSGTLRLLEPLLAPMFRRGVQRDLRTLQQLVEAQTACTSDDPACSKVAAASRR